MFREAMELVFNQYRSEIVIYKNYGKENQSDNSVLGMKNKEEHFPLRDYFDFLDRIDINPGDVIKQKASSELWVVSEIGEDIVGDEFLFFKAYVENKSRPASSHGTYTQHVINSPGAVIANNLSHTNLVTGNHNTLQKDLDGLLNSAKEDASINEAQMREIKECVFEISQSLKAGIKPKSAAEKLITLTGKFSSIASFGLNVGKTILENIA